MSNNDPLKAYFEASEAPAADIAFRLGVMGTVARRRFQIELALEVALFAGLTLCLALLWPVLDATLLSVGRSMTQSLAIVTLLAALAFAGRWVATHRLRLPLPHWVG